MHLTLVESKNYHLLYKECKFSVRSQLERMVPLVFKFELPGIWVDQLVEDGSFNLIFEPMVGPHLQGYIFCTQHSLRNFVTERCVPKCDAGTRALGNLFYRATASLWNARICDFGDKTFVLEWPHEGNAIVRRNS